MREDKKEEIILTSLKFSVITLTFFLFWNKIHVFSKLQTIYTNHHRWLKKVLNFLFYYSLKLSSTPFLIGNSVFIKVFCDFFKAFFQLFRGDWCK